MKKPLYQQVISDLEKKIKTEMKPNDRLPSERQLLKEYGVSRNTIRLALNDLDCLNGTRYHFSAGEYIYSMFSSELDMNNPDLVKPVLDWAQKQNIEVKNPILVDYFFRIKSQEKYCYYYAVTIPLADCSIRIESL